MACTHVRHQKVFFLTCVNLHWVCFGIILAILRFIRRFSFWAYVWILLQAINRALWLDACWIIIRDEIGSCRVMTLDQSYIRWLKADRHANVISEIGFVCNGILQKCCKIRGKLLQDLFEWSSLCIETKFLTTETVSLWILIFSKHSRDIWRGDWLLKM